MSDTTLPAPRNALRAAQLKELKSFARRFARNPLGMVGLIIVLLLLFCAAFAPWIATHDPLSQNLAERLQAPSPAHWFGTDQIGRDLFSRIVYVLTFVLGWYLIADAATTLNRVW